MLPTFSFKRVFLIFPIDTGHTRHDLISYSIRVDVVQLSVVLENSLPSNLRDKLKAKKRQRVVKQRFAATSTVFHSVYSTLSTST